MAVTYIQGSDLPDLAITWEDNDGDIIDYSSGWTFDALIGTPGSSAEFAKSTGFIGAATAPNLVLIWSATGELNSLTPRKKYTVTITATRTSDSRQRRMTVELFIASAVLPVAP